MRRRFGSDSRICKRSEYERVRTQGLQRYANGFLVQAARVPDGVGVHRLGVIASKRAVGNAVSRNRAKRVFRGLFRETDFGNFPPCDWVVLVRGSYAKRSHAELKTDWNRVVCWLGERLGSKVG